MPLEIMELAKEISEVIHGNRQGAIFLRLLHDRIKKKTERI